MNLRPLAPWVGGKYKIADQIINLMNIPSYCTDLISPTCGGLGFETKFYSKYPNFHYYSSDNNTWLINLYQIIKKYPVKFYKAIYKYDKKWKSLRSKELRKKWYYFLRDQFNYSKISNFEKAVLFLILVKTGYNGLMQINNKGELTTAFGFGVVDNLIDLNNYKQFVKFTKKCKFNNSDYFESLKYINDESVVYIDPLYKDSKQIYSSNLEDSSVKKLISFMKASRDKGAPITTMSNSYDPRFWQKLLPDAEIYTIERNQGIHRDVVKKGRHKVKENLIILRNY